MFSYGCDITLQAVFAKYVTTQNFHNTLQPTSLLEVAISR